MPDDLIPEDQEEQLRLAFAQLEAEYNQPGEGEEESTEETETEEQEENGGDGGSTVEDPEIVIGDNKLKTSELAELLRLRDFLDGGVAASIKSSTDALEQARLRSATPPPSAYTPPPPPEGLDLDDPQIKALWERSLQVEQMVENQRVELQRRQLADTTDQVERAVTDWNNKYKLDDSTIRTLRESAAKTGIAAVVTAPLESGGQGKSVYEGVAQALEAAFWSDPKLRNQYLLAAEQQAKSTAAADKSKQRKLSSLSGRTSTVGSTKPPAQMTAEERKAGMIAELTAALESR